MSPVAKRPKPKPSSRPNVRDLIARELRDIDVEGFLAARDEYGQDFARELADLEAGRHPLQRPRPKRAR